MSAALSVDEAVPVGAVLLEVALAEGSGDFEDCGDSELVVDDPDDPLPDGGDVTAPEDPSLHAASATVSTPAAATATALLPPHVFMRPDPTGPFGRSGGPRPRVGRQSQFFRRKAAYRATTRSTMSTVLNQKPECWPNPG